MLYPPLKNVVWPIFFRGKVTVDKRFHTLSGDKCWGRMINYIDNGSGIIIYRKPFFVITDGCFFRYRFITNMSSFLACSLFLSKDIPLVGDWTLVNIPNIPHHPGVRPDGLLARTDRVARGHAKGAVGLPNSSRWY